MVKMLRWSVLVVLLAAPFTASAGGIITDGRSGVGAIAQVAMNTTTQQVALTVPVNASVVVPVNTAMVPTTTTPPPATGAGTGTITPLELKQIEEGLITYEEAASGCASAGSSFGFVSLALVGLALLRRR